MSGACAYGVSTRCCAACRERALELSGLPSPGACALVFPGGVAVRPEELNQFLRPLPACLVLCAAASAPVEALLFRSPLFLYITFEDFKAADVYDGDNAFRILRVAGEKPVLGTLNDYDVAVRRDT
jgi:hypothetical protein